MRRSVVGGLAWLASVACAGADRAPRGASPPGEGWPAYGGDAGGTRHSALADIDRDNVRDLVQAWVYRTGEMSHELEAQGPPTGCAACHTGDAKFEATPILADGLLYLGTPMNRIVALDAASGEERWTFDPALKTDLDRNEGFVSRGVAHWDGGGSEGPCRRRVFMGTVDAELLAVDAETGAPCAGFGSGGRVRLDVGVGDVQEGQFGVTSPPVVVGHVVVVGSSQGDNRRTDSEWGTVRGYDAVTGALRWAFDPIPKDPSDPGWGHWEGADPVATGGGNAWAPLSADLDLGLVFVPTGSASPDFYGGERPGDNLYANAVVALRATTGEVAWHFQVVRHDLWDYDVPAQPSLITVPIDGRDVPAVAVGTKMGFVYLLDRETGEPLFPVEERPVPASDVPGEAAWPTQPFPTHVEPLHPLTFSEADVWGPTEAHRAWCLSQFRGFRSEGVFTPPSVRGTLMFPGNGGGINWGGMAWDPDRHLLVTNLMRLPFWVRLQRRPEGVTRGNQRGTPYTMSRGTFMHPEGIPCSAPPWGTLVAVDLVTGAKRWEIPFGFIPPLAERVPEARGWGSPNLGGPIVTAGGLVFVAATMDSHLRAYDVESGEELWSAALPAGGQATPMTYRAGGRQYVAIAAGGHPNLGAHYGDYVVAFALP